MMGRISIGLTILGRVRQNRQTTITVRFEPASSPWLAGAFGFRHAVEVLEKMVHTCDLKCMVHTIADANQGKAAPIFLMSHIGTHQRANASRIYVRDFA